MSLRDDPNFPRSALGTVILVLCSMPLLAAASLVQRGSAELALDRLMASKATLEEAVAMDADSEVPRRLLDIVNARLGKGDTSAVRTPIDPVPLPDSIRPVLDGPTPDSGAFIQLRATAIRFLPESQWRRTAYYQAKVLDRSGVDALSSFQFSFDPLAERLYVNSLEVLDESGAIVHTGELSSYYIADSSDEEFASQDRAPYARRGAGAGQDDSVHGHA